MKSSTNVGTRKKQSTAAVSFSPPTASSSLPLASENVVKVESDTNDEGPVLLPQNPPSRFSADEFLALWRHAAESPHQHKHHNSTTFSPHLGTLTIGSVVFAPCRVQSGPAQVGKSAHAFPYHNNHHSSFSSSGPHLSSPLYTLHYGLAEVTGIQVMAGTVTVSFLFTDPGVDDEAISLYECIPCPPACLARWLHEEGVAGDGGTVSKIDSRTTRSRGGGGAPSPSVCCSLLERVMHVAPEDSPLPVNDIYRTLVSPLWRNGHGKASQLSASQQRCATRLRDLYCVSDNDDDNEGDDERVQGGKKTVNFKSTSPTSDAAAEDIKKPLKFLQKTGNVENADDASAVSTTLFTWESLSDSTAATVLSAHYRAPLTLHVFFARVFQAVNIYTEQQQQQQRRRSFCSTTPASPSPLWQCLNHRSGVSVRTPPVILVLFDSYAALRRFHVYMTVRGHIVQLQDGTDSSTANNTSAYAGKLSSLHSANTNNNTTASAATAATPNDICQGRPPPPLCTPHAFGTECKVWICMLRDDTAEEDANAKSEGAPQIIAAQLHRLLAYAPPIDAVVTFIEHERDLSTNKNEAEGRNTLITAEQVLLRLLPHLTTAWLVCKLHDVPPPPLRPGPNAKTTTSPTNTPATNTQQATVNVVKVSGAIFGDHKLLVPCSPEQLTLLASVLADDPPPLHSSPPLFTDDARGVSSAEANPRRSAQKRPRTSDEAVHALTPALLERIALGTFTDSAASALFDAFGDAAAVVVPSMPSPSSPTTAAADAIPLLHAVPQVVDSVLVSHCTPPTLLGTVEDVYEKWCVDPVRFGEAFPVFQAVYALVADVFRRPALFRSHSKPPQSLQGEEGLGSPSSFSPGPSALPRIAIVLPRGNPTHHPSLSTQQFLRTLRLFFTPWTLHEVEPVATTGNYARAAAASAVSVTTAVGSSSGVSVGSPAPPFFAASASNACVLWHQRGGLLLLFCDEVATQLGALQDEADVVIACGKAAAAWVAANQVATTQPGQQDQQRHQHLDASPSPSSSALQSSVTYFAVISEIEVVPAAEHGAHLWLPITLPAPSLDSTHDKENDTMATNVSHDSAESAALRWPTNTSTKLTGEAELTRGQAEVLWERLLFAVGTDSNAVSSPAGPSSIRSVQQPRRLRNVDVLPKTLRQAIFLWRHLGEKPANDTPVYVPESNGDSPWPMLRGLMKAIALSNATAAPIRMSDVMLVRRTDGAWQ